MMPFHISKYFAVSQGEGLYPTPAHVVSSSEANHTGTLNPFFLTFISLTQNELMYKNLTIGSSCPVLVLKGASEVQIYQLPL